MNTGSNVVSNERTSSTTAISAAPGAVKTGKLNYAGENMGLADLHIHTIYSWDGTASVPAVLTRAKQIGLDVIAITDHDEIDGALEAMELAPRIGIEVIPGIEISTAEGDLLALNVTRKIERDQSLTKTVLKVGELGGICIAPHPMDDGFTMHSLGSYPIMKAWRDPDVAKILIAIETYNASILKKASNGYARILAERLGIAQTGSSDAHVLKAVGLGATEFPGHTSKELLNALRGGLTIPRMGEEWGAVRILGSWAMNYIARVPGRLAAASPSWRLKWKQYFSH